MGRGAAAGCLRSSCCAQPGRGCAPCSAPASGRGVQPAQRRRGGTARGERLRGTRPASAQLQPSRSGRCYRLAVDGCRPAAAPHTRHQHLRRQQVAPSAPLLVIRLGTCLLLSPSLPLKINQCCAAAAGVRGAGGEGRVWRGALHRPVLWCVAAAGCDTAAGWSVPLFSSDGARLGSLSGWSVLQSSTCCSTVAGCARDAGRLFTVFSCRRTLDCVTRWPASRPACASCVGCCCHCRRRRRCSTLAAGWLLTALKYENKILWCLESKLTAGAAPPSTCRLLALHRPVRGSQAVCQAQMSWRGAVDGR